jgi:hypothetical protein
MIPEQSIAKWQAAKERAAAQSHFNDLCELLDEANPTDADRKGERYCFERGATKPTAAKLEPRAPGTVQTVEKVPDTFFSRHLFLFPLTPFPLKTVADTFMPPGCSEQACKLASPNPMAPDTRRESVYVYHGSSV